MYVFLTVLEAAGAGSKVMVSADLVPGQQLLPHRRLSFAIMLCGRRGVLALWGLFHKDTNHIHGTLPS